MLHHELLRDGHVIRVYVNGKLTSLKLSVDKPHEIREFLRDPTTPDAVVEDRLRELATTGRTAFDVSE